MLYFNIDVAFLHSCCISILFLFNLQFDQKCADWGVHNVEILGENSHFADRRTVQDCFRPACVFTFSSGPHSIFIGTHTVHFLSCCHEHDKCLNALFYKAYAPMDEELEKLRVPDGADDILRNYSQRLAALIDTFIDRCRAQVLRGCEFAQAIDTAFQQTNADWACGNFSCLDFETVERFCLTSSLEWQAKLRSLFVPMLQLLLSTRSPAVSLAIRKYLQPSWAIVKFSKYDRLGAQAQYRAPLQFQHWCELDADGIRLWSTRLGAFDTHSHFCWAFWCDVNDFFRVMDTGVLKTLEK
jgi:hypothetical protein